MFYCFKQSHFFTCFFSIVNCFAFSRSRFSFACFNPSIVHSIFCCFKFISTLSSSILSVTILIFSFVSYSHSFDQEFSMFGCFKYTYFSLVLSVPVGICFYLQLFLSSSVFFFLFSTSDLLF